MSYCYMNGSNVQYQECKVHISDLMLQRGYGIFDYFRCRDGKIHWLEDYTERLFNSIQLASLEVEFNKEEFISIIHDLQSRNGYDNGAFKVMVTGGYSETLDSVTGAANVIILNLPWQPSPAVNFEKGVSLVTSEYTRPDPEIKSLYYFNLLKLSARRKEFGAVDVLYHGKLITETSRANVFFVKGNKVYTPKSDILKGVTRKQLLTLFPDIQVVDIEAEGLYDFDEMFITSTSRDITPVAEVEGKKIGTGKPGKTTREIMEVFRKMGW